MRNFITAMVIVVTASVPAVAAETITWSYDAHGRLVQVVHTGTANNGQKVVYSHDAADNRVKLTASGAR